MASVQVVTDFRSCVRESFHTSYLDFSIALSAVSGRLTRVTEACMEPDRPRTGDESWEQGKSKVCLAKEH